MCMHRYVRPWRPKVIAGYQYPPLKKIICLFIYLLVYVTICGRVYVCRWFHMCNGGRVDGKDNFQE